MEFLPCAFPNTSRFPGSRPAGCCARSALPWDTGTVFTGCMIEIDDALVGGHHRGRLSVKHTLGSQPAPMASETSKFSVCYRMRKQKTQCLSHRGRRVFREFLGMEHNNSYNWHLCFSPSSPVLQSQKLGIERLFLHFCSIRTNEYELNQSATYISYCVPFLSVFLCLFASL